MYRGVRWPLSGSRCPERWRRCVLPAGYGPGLLAPVRAQGESRERRQLPKPESANQTPSRRRTTAGPNVKVHPRPDGTLSITAGPQRLGRTNRQKESLCLPFGPKNIVERTPPGEQSKCRLFPPAEAHKGRWIPALQALQHWRTSQPTPDISRGTNPSKKKIDSTVAVPYSSPEHKEVAFQEFCRDGAVASETSRLGPTLRNVA